MIWTLVAAQDIGGIVTGIGKLGLSIVGTLFILVLGFKALHHFSVDNHGALVGLLVVSIIVGFVIWDPTGLESVIKGTVKTIGG